MYNILVIDDDVQMLELVAQLLEREGYTTETATSERFVQKIIDYRTPDLFIIDVDLPDGDGLSLCRMLRRDPVTRDRPIIFIADPRSTCDAAQALAAGGDDYIEKPFAVRELMARIRANLRRVAQPEPESALPRLQFLNFGRTVLVDGREIELTHVEYDLLRHLCSAPTRLHSTHDLLVKVWQYPPDAGDAALVRNHIRNLRRKLELSPERPEIIQSRHGRGYTVRALVEFVDEPMARRSV
jgi:DNA-binding response OmpR family regulator